MSPQAVIILGAVVLAIGTIRLARRKDDETEPAPKQKQFNLEQYPPRSAELTELLAVASGEAGTPAQWASLADTHELVRKESGGWVGRPNYTYGQGEAGRRFGANISNPSQRARWPLVWAELRRGVVGAKSTATGIGQHLSSNAKRYYPDGLNGIGDAYNEAVGFLKYIEDRYGTPSAALAFHLENNWY